MSADALLFIDANKYLDLYRTVKGKKLLAPLTEQADNIFATEQLVAEVERNKIEIAAGFLVEQLKEIKVHTYQVPDHLFGSDEGNNTSIQQAMGKLSADVKAINADIEALITDILTQIIRGEDQVSKALVPVFAKARPHTPDELQRARDRKERGNPPGKKTDPIGDELTWEQLLARFKGKKRLWIISRDTDYGTIYKGGAFLNSFLLSELNRIAGKAEVHLFHDTVDGLIHFGQHAGVTAEKLPTPENAKEIKQEERALPPLDWLGNLSNTDKANLKRRFLARFPQLKKNPSFAAALLAAQKKSPVQDDPSRPGGAGSE